MTTKILAVDDDAVNLETVTLTLTREGYTLLKARDGREALAVAEQSHPDLIVLDVMMPEMDGYEVCKRIRGNPALANTLIILLTATTSVDSRLQGFEAGADDFMAKPYHPAELRARVQALLRRRTPESPETLSRQQIHSKTIAFYSLRGGVGVSALATNVAVAFSQIWSVPAALVDLALTCGQSALMLNQTLRHTWADLAALSVDDCTLELVEQVMMDHESGVRILAAPPSSEKAETVTPATVERAIELLSSKYAYVVLDLPHDFRDTTLVALDRADVIAMVFAPEIGSVYAAKRALDTFNALGYSRERISLIMNWTFEKQGLARKSIEGALGLPVTYVVPFVDSLLVEALNRGIPAVTYFAGKPLATVFEDLAYQMSRPEDVEQAPTSPSAVWKRVMARQVSARGHKGK